MNVSLGAYETAVNAALAQMDADTVVSRIWNHDHTVWKTEPTEITNRLGWLRIAEAMRARVGEITALVDDVRAAGMTHALLLGMGGSSLAPEVMRATFGVKEGYLELAILDSTDPAYVLQYAKSLSIEKTLFIVATKSGGTAETLSGFKYFYNAATKAVGDAAGSHFVAITDPGSKLEDIARKYAFRKTFLNDPNIGGRYSALSFFGMVPAGLIGADVGLILERGVAAAAECAADVPIAQNAAAVLGAAMAELAGGGRDKLTFVSSRAIANIEDWIEQLVAESTGKEGKGVVPIVAEPFGDLSLYGDDRFFVYLKLAGGDGLDADVAALRDGGQPFITLEFADRYDLGRQFVLWEFATAVCGHRMGISPFDQPDVESAKIQAREMIEEFHAKGTLPAEAPAFSSGGVSVYGDVSASSVAEAIDGLVAGAGAGGYVSFQAYVNPSEAAQAALQELRAAVSRKTKFAATIGYGPRFLHSTGQLHKGDAGRGVFVQFTSDSPEDVPIPDEAGADASAMTFGVLEAAQALGDRRALLQAGRKVIRVHFGSDAPAGILEIAHAL
jgi:glucose-6-phosphate isomerase